MIRVLSPSIFDAPLMTSRFRGIRRASHEALNKARVTEFYSLHAKEAVRMIDGILQNPNKWDVEFLWWV